jgi:hypothetical protein
MTDVYYKILMNHIILLLIVQTFNITWPSFIQNLFSEAGNIASQYNNLISLDCFFDFRDKETFDAFANDPPDLQF